MRWANVIVIVIVLSRNQSQNQKSRNKVKIMTRIVEDWWCLMMKLLVTGIWLKWMIHKWGKNGEAWDNGDGDGDDDGGVWRVGKR